ncbi:MAG TPA: PAS domain S-box protein [Anaerolineae bacterium]|nr:PAS domain S-box protein [Anaerolineae bacterium]
MNHPTSPPYTPSVSVRRSTRAIIILVVISLLIAATFSLLLMSTWQQDRSNALWHIAFDVAFGLGLTLLIIWLTQRTIVQMEITEQALRHSEERLQRIIDNSLDLISEIDAQGILRFASPSYLAVLGYEPERLVGRSLTEYIHPDDAALVQFSAEQVRQEGYASSRLEFRVRHSAGHYLWLEASRQFVWDEHNQISSIVLISRDITSRKQSEDALARYARSMGALYEISLEINTQPDVAALLNAIVLRAIDLLSVKMGGLYLINQEDHSLVLVTSMPSELVGTVLQSGEGLAGRIVQSGLPLFIADYSNWPDRAAAFAHSRIGRTLGVPLKLRGNIIGVLSVEDAEPGLFSEQDVRLASLFADQAAIAIENRQLYERAQRELLVRQQAEEALARSEERYRTLIENQGEGICYVDENENLTFANPAANEIFGIAPASLEGRNLNEFVSTEEFVVIRRETEIRRTGQTSTYENKIVRPDGERRTLLVTARPRFDEHGNFLGTFAIFRDITERKQAEEELARTRANLERSNQQLTQILEAGNLLRMNLNLDAVLREIVTGAHRALGYNMVVLNLVDETTQRMKVHSHAGLDNTGQQMLTGGSYDWKEERRLLRAEFRLGHAYFIPHGALDWQRELSGPMYVPNLPVSDRLDDWHPDDVLFIPIELRDGRIVGTIWLDAPQDGKRPTIESLRPLEIFVNQAAIAIENARLFEAERQRHRELEAVYAASRQVTQSLDLSEVLDAILNSVMQLVPATNAQLFLYDGERLKFGSGLSEHGQKMAWPSLEPRPEGLTYTVAHTGQPIFIEDTAHHPVYNVTSALPSPLLAIAGLPLKMGDTILGVMNISYATPHTFGESERSVLGLLAAQASIALHNARLHQQVQRYAEDLEQRVAERTAELEHERQHLQAILDSAGEGIQIMNPAGQIIYVNPATERITGYPSSEMVGETTRLWSDDINSATKLGDLREQIVEGQSWQGEIINRRKDNTLYDAAITVTPLKDKQQQVTGFVVVHRDITHLKELERLKDQFVSRIGHELRTPIANIKLYTQLLEHGKPDKQHDYLQTIQREIERLTHLNDRFLEMAELDAARTAPQLSLVDANQLLKDLLRNFEPIAQQRNLILESQLDPSLTGSPVTTDRALLARAVGNIVENALHYAPHGATVSVSTHVNTEAEAHSTSITVHNTGPGISSEELPHMFERFYRGEAARDYRVPGAGLGLAIAQTIMQRLNGRLTVDSQLGQGVTFTLWLK